MSDIVYSLALSSLWPSLFVHDGVHYPTMSFEIVNLALVLVVSVAFIVLASRKFELHPFLALILAALFFGLATGQGFSDTLKTMQAGFGSLMQQIGLVVVLGALLGTVMEKTGAMYTVGLVMANLFRHRVAMAMMATGLLVGIPVFADSGFIILSKMLPAVAPGSVPTVLSLATGLYTTHTLVPPTPGPLTAAVNLGLANDLGLVMLIAACFSVSTGGIAWLLTIKFGRKFTLTQPIEPVTMSRIPGWRAFTPIVIPVLLIAVGASTAFEFFPRNLTPIARVIGMPVYALIIGLVLAFILRPRNTLIDWPRYIGASLQDAGSILLITAAGGAFGATIKSSGLEAMLSSFQFGHGSLAWIMILAFIIAALLKTAQGSTTSAMIITSALLAPVATAAEITSAWHLSLLLMAIAGGGMTVSHVNDSYFWVVARFGSIDHKQLMQSYTPITAVMGLTVLFMAILLALLT